MWICRYFLYFLFCSFIGWFYECIYGIFATGEWENRGFLYGPVCPIYGIGAVSVMGIMHFFRLAGYDIEKIPSWQIFLLAFFGSIVLEYGTHYLLEKLFHACWWDYSNLPFNVNGRICLPASILFGLAGILVVKYLAPYLNHISSMVTPIWIEAIGMLTLAIGAADATLTVSALTNFERYVAQIDESLNGRMENLVENLQEKKDDAGSWIIARKDGAGDWISGKKDSAGDWISDNKERLYNLNVNTVIDYMSDSYKSALSRVTGFRGLPSKVTGQASRTAGMMNLALREIKKRVHMPKRHK